MPIRSRSTSVASAIWTSHRDLAQLIGIGLDHPGLGFEIVYGVSGNSRTWWDNTGAEQLGYRPEDNAESWVDTVMATAPEDPDAPGADVQGGAFAVLESGARASRGRRRVEAQMPDAGRQPESDRAPAAGGHRDRAPRRLPHAAARRGLNIPAGSVAVSPGVRDARRDNANVQQCP